MRLHVQTSVQRRDFKSALADLKSRTLDGIAGEVTRLVYLASTRDYNTARYYHDGLSRQFAPEVAEAALDACHQETFQNLISCPLENLVEELETYIQSTGEQPVDVLAAWQRLQPYRVTIPLNCDPLFADFFFSNVRIALAILQARREGCPRS